MNLFPLFLALHVIFAFPDPAVKWSGAEHKSVKIDAPANDEFVAQCLKGGLEVRYRYEVRLCRRRVLWADRCEDARNEVHAVQYDPISEAYRVSNDIIGDNVSPTVIHYSSQSEALAAVGSMSALTLSELGYSSSAYPENRGPYLGVRVIADCKGDYNETIAKISYLLTLGLLDMGTFDSGWIAFRIE